MTILFTISIIWLLTVNIDLVLSLEADLSNLNSNQIQVWNEAKSKIIETDTFISVISVHHGQLVDVPTFRNIDQQVQSNRYLFKQNINKMVDWYLSANQLNPLINPSTYDACRGSLFQIKADESIAGFYLAVDKYGVYPLAFALVNVANKFKWFHGTEPFHFQDENRLTNGTKLALSFEATVVYNSNTDFESHNNYLNDLVRNAAMLIRSQTAGETMFMENLLCRRHSKIIRNSLRLTSFICHIDITFRCPLSKGSSCWVENASLSNLVFLFNYRQYFFDEKITFQIDV